MDDLLNVETSRLENEDKDSLELAGRRDGSVQKMQ